MLFLADTCNIPIFDIKAGYAIKNIPGFCYPSKFEMVKSDFSHTCFHGPIFGWGRFPVQDCYSYRPEKIPDLREILFSGRHQSFIPRGLGRSYGDTSLNENSGVIDITRLNHMIGFVPPGIGDNRSEFGILTLESGVSLADIIDDFLPRGYFLPVTPGTKYVTVGGAIANDVHGKNHHYDGSFSEFVLDFDLLLPTGDVIKCSRDENSEIFWATVGGIGLTGFILTARILLRKIETAYIKVDQRRAKNLDEVIELMDQYDPQYRFSVAWIDCLSSGSLLGRSVLMHGRHATVEDLPRDIHEPLDFKHKRKKKIPVDFPSIALNPLSIMAFNYLYYEIHPTELGKIENIDDYFYPLDAVDDWNKMYGSAGFAQFQAYLPFDKVDALKEILVQLGKSGNASFLAVLKRFGKANKGLLSCPKPGYMLALDIPNHSGLLEQVAKLEKILLDNGGRVYFAKDSTAKAETVAAMYENLGKVREIKKRIDPKGLLSSSMARRLRIV